MPKKPIERKRVALNCLIAPETREAMERIGGSQGRIVDRGIAALGRESDGESERVEIRGMEGEGKR